jgi:hypothetical protein
MYQLTDVLDVNDMRTKKDALHIIGKDFELEDVEVGKQAKLNNISDAHMFYRVTKTSIIDSVKESFREVNLVAKDTMYILRKY